LFLWIFIAAASLQILYWAIFFGRLAFFSSKQEIAKIQPPVSIIVCARNEAENLQNNLSYLLSQEYPEFEVIVADDDSNDNSFDIIHNYSNQYPNLKVVQLKNKSTGGKKEALLEAVKKAKYDWLLMTDADCRPDKNWISTMIQNISNAETEIVLAYGPYRSYPTLLNTWIRFETLLTAIQYFSAALWGMPYMGVGRNLLIKKSIWLSNLYALEKNSDLMSGDDDLMVNAAANKKNTVICLEKESFVFSEPKQQLKAFLIQKSRHYSSGTRYKTIHKLFLGAFSLSLCTFWLSAPVAFFYWPKVVIIFFMVRLIVFLIINYKILRILHEQKLFSKLIFFDTILAFYYLFFAPTLIIKNRKKWK
jgi:cellulose synthase/poly-beta-1,6-N-acetylglucosamine synthase-like glycosyltransferase